MPTIHQPLFPDAFLVVRWATDYAAFRGSPHEEGLLRRLKDWAARKPQKEITAEAAFVGVFFKQSWGYSAAGEGPKNEGHTCEPQYPVKGAGQGGGTGLADLALGYFDRAGVPMTPQAFCEFKSVHAGLDSPQRRKGNDRSPVKQCADYIKAAGSTLYGNESVQPTWGIVSDMNEFRLYWRNKMPAQYQRFVLAPTAGDNAISLLAEGEAAAFQRFVFWKMFQRDMLLSRGGPSPLEQLLTDQWVQERTIENDFYKEYQSYRQKVFDTLVDANPNFGGTRSKLVRLTQRFLDRCIFILFCEDMGAALKFPPHILRDVLAGVSADPDYDAHDDNAWTRVKKLFASMRDGSPFREHHINRFNGGLFAPEPELESLHIPTHLFCARGQGASPQDLTHHKKTLLYFSATYNFGVTGATMERSIGLYTLGRIFEQSITELEFMEAKADGRASITELSKRKRDGVYYTPERITSYIVEETVGAHLVEARRKFALDPAPALTDEELDRYRKARAPTSAKANAARRPRTQDKRFKAERVEQYMASLDRYAAELDDLKVLDPACGSGAFLIQALDRLVNERRWLAAERERIMGGTTPFLFDIDAVTKAVLAQNIYGVDINEESVEITRLALWLHTALPDRPLSLLNSNIRCGNSLIDEQFYSLKQEDLFTEEQRDRINAFDWKAAFPQVFARPDGKTGFDCIIGNPPYVKLQHFRKVLPNVAEYLLAATKTTSDGLAPLYASAQTQNFDMYLPFIERGVSLLNQDGRMGFIAPSVWLISEYGEGFRRLIKKTRSLERWVDFKDCPVFDDVMTYTAIQLYRGKPSEDVKCVFAPTGELGAIEWDRPDVVIPYSELSEERVWVLLPKREQDLLEALSKRCVALADLPGILVGVRGVESGADEFYHFHRVGRDTWTHAKVTGKEEDDSKVAAGRAHEIPLEEELMRPLVSGSEARRYVRPATDTYVLFPYDVTGRPRLLSQTELASRYPQTWAYLKQNERKLRARERGRMDRDDGWWGYNYPKNMDKHHLPKLGVAQTIPEMRVFHDAKGAFCFNNVRVSGIIAEDEATRYFLMGVLNSRVVDFVFRRIAKPKEPRPSGAYFEANKQYIAPLPIPRATEHEKEEVITLARELEALHSARRDTIVALDKRLDSAQMVAVRRTHKWLWADEDLAAHLSTVKEAMTFGSTMCADFVDGELRFYVRDRCIVSGVYVNDEEAPLILAQWRRVARDTFVSDTVNAARIVEWLLDLKTTENTALISQIRKLNDDLKTTESSIVTTERALDDLVNQLYGLTAEERHMVESDTRTRWEARIPQPPVNRS